MMAVVLLASPAVLLSTGAGATVVGGAVVDPALLEATCLVLPQPPATRAQTMARANRTHR
jgi:hypothetical protein